MTIQAKFSEVPVGREVLWQGELWRKSPVPGSEGKIFCLTHRDMCNRMAKVTPDTEVEVVAPI